MTLSEITAVIANELKLDTQPATDEQRSVLAGRGVEAVVSPFFGGWQVELILPTGRRLQYFEEDVRMLVRRVGARITDFEQHQGMRG